MAPPGDKPSAGFWTLHRHDARNLETLFARNSNGRSPLVTATITSPPYGGLKDYGPDNQIGFGQSYEGYLRDMEAVFRQIHHRTAADGSLWLIADTYVASGQAPRRLMPVPFDLANAAEAAGFTLRDVIIWQKDRTLPWSNGTRLRNAFEYVLLLVKGPSPKYRIDRLREHEGLKEWWVRFPERYNPNGKAPPNVWDIPIPKQGSWGDGEIAHACPLPPELVRRLILLSTDEGDVVLDPFAGSGVVVAEAERLGRLGIGTELVEKHVDEFTRIIRPEILGRDTDATANGEAPRNGNGSHANADLLIKLRILKLPVVLMRGAAKRRGEIAWPLGAVVLPSNASPAAGRFAAAKLYLVVKGFNAAQRKAYASTLRDLADRAPASKFGIDCEIEVVNPSKLPELVAGRKIFLYRNGGTSRTVGSIPHKQIGDSLDSAQADSTPPILSSIFVDVPPRPERSLHDDAGSPPRAKHTS
jgi:DNA modification methylase